MAMISIVPLVRACAVGKSPGECWVTFNAEDFGLSLSAMRDLQKKLDHWLQSRSVGVEAFCGHFELGRSPSCKLDLLFAPRADTIASPDKPVVTINLSLDYAH